MQHLVVKNRWKPHGKDVGRIGMSVLIRRQGTRYYLTAAGEWTDKMEAAQKFESASAAVVFALRANLKTYDVVEIKSAGRPGRVLFGTSAAKSKAPRVKLNQSR